jgi:hypothetical protein
MGELVPDRGGGAALDNHGVDSTLELKLVDPLSDSDWDRLAFSHPDSTFFHSAGWAKVLSKTYRHKPFYLHFYRQTESLALAPVMEIRSPFTGCRGVCLPFSDFCGPLVFNRSESNGIMNKLSELALQQNWRYVEFRGGRETLPDTAAPAVQFYSHTLRLRASLDDLWPRFGSGTRRAIRKAQKSGLNVEVTGTRPALREFYRLHVATRRRHGLPPQPLSFFVNIYEEIIKPGDGFIVLARSGSRILAAAVFFRYGKTAVYKFGASDELFQEFRGNNLVMWEAIKFLTQGGCKMLHFGRTSLGNEGLRRFKAGWGATEGILEYFRFVPQTKAWKTGTDSSSGLHNKFFRTLPKAVNRLAGAVIYPHLD